MASSGSPSIKPPATPGEPSPAASSEPLTHLKAFTAALVVLVIGLMVSSPFFGWIEKPFMRSLLALPYSEKDQGMLMQRQAFVYDDVLPIYGSSELRNEMDRRADEVFRTKPKGFQVCPVGAAGNTTLMMAQKIAAQGSAVHGDRIAFILSHTWFRRPQVPEGQMAGNFSPLQVLRLLLNSKISDGLRQRYVTRLLEFPDTMEKHPLIRAYMKDMQTQTAWSKVEMKLLDPVLRIYASRLAFEDHLNTLGAIVTYRLIGHGTWHPRPSRFRWGPLIRRKEREVTDEDKLAIKDAALMKDGPGDAGFIESMKNAREWEDYNLLLDTLKELKAKALIISVPMPGPSLNRKGVSRAARDYYYSRITDMANDHGFPAAAFTHQDLAVDFLEGTGTHLEEKGWLYVNRLLDDFYHDRLSMKDASGT